VLIRALEPVRAIAGKSTGPGLLCQAPRIDRRHDGLDLPGDELSLAEPDDRGLIEIVARPRIGVANASTWATRPPRCSIRGNAFVSRW
jgi:DNA-3-methyladenine glycosylase